MAEELFIQGNEACAKGAIAAGCRFFAGYPITPSTEVAETLARELPKVGGSFVQMEDEIASAGAIIGEFLAARNGLGYLIIYSSQVFKLDWLLMSIVLLCLIAMGLYWSLKTLENIINRPDKA